MIADDRYLTAGLRIARVSFGLMRVHVWWMWYRFSVEVVCGMYVDLVQTG